MAGWAPRVDQWNALPEHERCYETGCVLLVHNANPYAAKKWQAHLDEGLRAAGELFKKDIQETRKYYEEQVRLGRANPSLLTTLGSPPYPPNCFNNTMHHKRFRAGQEEHSRLCEDHAREQGWLW